MFVNVESFNWLPVCVCVYSSFSLYSSERLFSLCNCMSVSKTKKFDLKHQLVVQEYVPNNSHTSYVSIFLYVLHETVEDKNKKLEQNKNKKPHKTQWKSTEFLFNYPQGFLLSQQTFFAVPLLVCMYILNPDIILMV